MVGGCIVAVVGFEAFATAAELTIVKPVPSVQIGGRRPILVQLRESLVEDIPTSRTERSDRPRGAPIEVSLGRSSTEPNPKLPRRWLSPARRQAAYRKRLSFHRRATFLGLSNDLNNLFKLSGSVVRSAALSLLIAASTATAIIVRSSRSSSSPRTVYRFHRFEIRLGSRYFFTRLPASAITFSFQESEFRVVASQSCIPRPVFRRSDVPE